ncbi:MAG: redox-sensing transcriptional repressor Rex [Phycisphaerae bacterium]
MPNSLSEKAIARLSVYRRVLTELLRDGRASVRSDDLASAAGVTASQARRDLMLVSALGTNKGYDTAKLLRAVEDLLDPHEPQEVALVGVGNIGRALLAYFAGRRPKLDITVAFDNDPSVTGRLIHGCPCRHVTELHELISQREIHTAIIAVPESAAQQVAESLVAAGVRGIMNFAPVRLRIPEGVYVDSVDLTSSLEKAAFFARQRSREAKGLSNHAE